MSGIVEWLLEQVAADEAVAKAIMQETPYGEHPITAEEWVAAAGVVMIEFEGGPLGSESHVMRWSPTRVLAECAAKRARIALLAEEATPEYGLHTGISPESWLSNQLLMIEAQPYADRPGYDPAWSAE